MAEAKGFDLQLKRNITGMGESGTIKATDYDNDSAINAGLTATMRERKVRKEDNMVEIQYLAMLRDLCTGYTVRDSSETIVKAVNRFFYHYFGIDPKKENAIHIQNILLRGKNEETFRNNLKKAIETYEPERKKKVLAKNRDDFYELTTANEDVFSSETHTEMPDIRLNYFDKYYQSNSASAVEKDFERWLESRPESVAYWYKNGVSKRTYFGIPYFKGTDCRTFYPDYLVKLTNGKTWIIDTKKGATAEDATERAECLQLWLEKQGENTEGGIFEGGIVVPDGESVWRVNRQKNYVYSAKFLGDGWAFLLDCF